MGKNHRHTGFYEALEALKVNPLGSFIEQPVRSALDQPTEPETLVEQAVFGEEARLKERLNSTYTLETLDYLHIEVKSADFRALYDVLRPLCASLPALLATRARVCDALLADLNRLKSVSELKPVLTVALSLIRDLGTQTELPFIIDLMVALAAVSRAHSEIAFVKMVFEVLARLMHTAKSVILDNYDVVLDTFIPHLLFHPQTHVRFFSAESLAYCLRHLECVGNDDEQMSLSKGLRSLVRKSILAFSVPNETESKRQRAVNLIETLSSACSEVVKTVNAGLVYNKAVFILNLFSHVCEEESGELSEATQLDTAKIMLATCIGFILNLKKHVKLDWNNRDFQRFLRTYLMSKGDVGNSFKFRLASAVLTDRPQMKVNLLANGQDTRNVCWEQILTEDISEIVKHVLEWISIAFEHQSASSKLFTAASLAEFLPPLVFNTWIVSLTSGAFSQLSPTNSARDSICADDTLLDICSVNDMVETPSHVSVFLEAVLAATEDVGGSGDEVEEAKFRESLYPMALHHHCAAKLTPKFPLIVPEVVAFLLNVVAVAKNRAASAEGLQYLDQVLPFLHKALLMAREDVEEDTLNSLVALAPSLGFAQRAMLVRILQVLGAKHSIKLDLAEAATTHERILYWLALNDSLVSATEFVNKEGFDLLWEQSKRGEIKAKLARHWLTSGNIEEADAVDAYMVLQIMRRDDFAGTADARTVAGLLDMLKAPQLAVRSSALSILHRLLIELVQTQQPRDSPTKKRKTEDDVRSCLSVTDELLSLCCRLNDLNNAVETANEKQAMITRVGELMLGLKKIGDDVAVSGTRSLAGDVLPMVAIQTLLNQLSIRFQPLWKPVMEQVKLYFKSRSSHEIPALLMEMMAVAMIRCIADWEPRRKLFIVESTQKKIRNRFQAYEMFGESLSYEYQLRPDNMKQGITEVWFSQLVAHMRPTAAPEDRCQISCTYINELNSLKALKNCINTLASVCQGASNQQRMTPIRLSASKQFSLVETIVRMILQLSEAFGFCSLAASSSPRGVLKLPSIVSGSLSNCLNVHEKSAVMVDCLACLEACLPLATIHQGSQAKQMLPLVDTVMRVLHEWVYTTDSPQLQAACLRVFGSIRLKGFNPLADELPGQPHLMMYLRLSELGRDMLLGVIQSGKNMRHQVREVQRRLEELNEHDTTVVLTVLCRLMYLRLTHGGSDTDESAFLDVLSTLPGSTLQFFMSLMLTAFHNTPHHEGSRETQLYQQLFATPATEDSVDKLLAEVAEVRTVRLARFVGLLQTLTQKARQSFREHLLPFVALLLPAFVKRVEEALEDGKWKTRLLNKVTEYISVLFDQYGSTEQATLKTLYNGLVGLLHRQTALGNNTKFIEVCASQVDGSLLWVFSEDPEIVRLFLEASGDEMDVLDVVRKLWDFAMNQDSRLKREELDAARMGRLQRRVQSSKGEKLVDESDDSDFSDVDLDEYTESVQQKTQASADLPERRVAASVVRHHIVAILTLYGSLLCRDALKPSNRLLGVVDALASLTLNMEQLPDRIVIARLVENTVGLLLNDRFFKRGARVVNSLSVALGNLVKSLDVGEHDAVVPCSLYGAPPEAPGFDLDLMLRRLMVALNDRLMDVHLSAMVYDKHLMARLMLIVTSLYHARGAELECTTLKALTKKLKDAHGKRVPLTALCDCILSFCLCKLAEGSTDSQCAVLNELKEYNAKKDDLFSGQWMNHLLTHIAATLQTAPQLDMGLAIVIQRFWDAYLSSFKHVAVLRRYIVSRKLVVKGSCAKVAKAWENAKLFAEYLSDHIMGLVHKLLASPRTKMHETGFYLLDKLMNELSCVAAHLPTKRTTVGPTDLTELDYPLAAEPAALMGFLRFNCYQDVEETWAADLPLQEMYEAVRCASTKLVSEHLAVSHEHYNLFKSLNSVQKNMRRDAVALLRRQDALDQLSEFEMRNVLLPYAVSQALQNETEDHKTHMGLHNESVALLCELLAKGADPQLTSQSIRRAAKVMSLRAAELDRHDQFLTVCSNVIVKLSPIASEQFIARSMSDGTGVRGNDLKTVKKLLKVFNELAFPPVKDEEGVRPALVGSILHIVKCLNTQQRNSTLHVMVGKLCDCLLHRNIGVRNQGRLALKAYMAKHGEDFPFVLDLMKAKLKNSVGPASLMITLEGLLKAVDSSRPECVRAVESRWESILQLVVEEVDRLADAMSITQYDDTGRHAKLAESTKRKLDPELTKFCSGAIVNSLCSLMTREGLERCLETLAGLLQPGTVLRKSQETPSKKKTDTRYQTSVFSSRYLERCQQIIRNAAAGVLRSLLLPVEEKIEVFASVLEHRIAALVVEGQRKERYSDFPLFRERRLELIARVEKAEGAALSKKTPKMSVRDEYFAVQPGAASGDAFHRHVQAQRRAYDLSTQARLVGKIAIQYIMKLLNSLPNRLCLAKPVIERPTDKQGESEDGAGSDAGSDLGADDAEALEAMGLGPSPEERDELEIATVPRYVRSPAELDAAVSELIWLCVDVYNSGEAEWHVYCGLVFKECQRLCGASSEWALTRVRDELLGRSDAIIKQVFDVFANTPSRPTRLQAKELVGAVDLVRFYLTRSATGIPPEVRSRLLNQIYLILSTEDVTPNSLLMKGTAVTLYQDILLLCWQKTKDSDEEVAELLAALDFTREDVFYIYKIFDLLVAITTTHASATIELGADRIHQIAVIGSSCLAHFLVVFPMNPKTLLHKLKQILAQFRYEEVEGRRAMIECCLKLTELLGKKLQGRFETCGFLMWIHTCIAMSDFAAEASSTLEWYLDGGLPYPRYVQRLASRLLKAMRCDMQLVDDTIKMLREANFDALLWAFSALVAEGGVACDKMMFVLSGFGSLVSDDGLRPQQFVDSQILGAAYRVPVDVPARLLESLTYLYCTMVSRGVGGAQLLPASALMVEVEGATAPRLRPAAALARAASTTPEMAAAWAAVAPTARARLVSAITRGPDPLGAYCLGGAALFG